MTTTNITPFRDFLAERRTWEIKIDDGKQGEVHSGEELISALRRLERGWYVIILRTSQGIRGSAQITKLMSGRLREDSATRSCIGIAAYYNEALREQGSEVGQ